MRTFFTFLLLCICTTFLLATHNRAGEITYEQIDTRTVKATIVTYAQTSSFPADRDSLRICWGDGQCEMLLRVNGGGAGEPIENDYKINNYVGTHTYNTMGTYQVSMTDPNRNSSILNVNSPNSDLVQFHLQSTLNVLPMNSAVTNTSPRLLVPPIDVGFVRQPFMHTPNAIDLDGDSIAYELVTPLMENDVPVPNYMQVDEIGAGDKNSYSFDEKTGLFVWNSPQVVGQYNIAIKIKAYRNGELIDMMIRDMQILIQAEENIPPEIEFRFLKETFVNIKAGQELAIEFSIYDAEDGFEVRVPQLTVTSEFIQQSEVTQTQQFAVLNGTFKWTPLETAIRTQPYQLVFKATDSQGGVTFRVVSIQVLPLSNGVSDNFKNLGYQLFPNPTKGISFLKVPDNALNQTANLSIFDNIGRLVKTQKIDQTTALTPISTTELPKGSYIIQLVSKESNVSTSLIVH